MKYLNVGVGEHSRILPLTKKKVNPNNSSVSGHLLFCNHSASFDNFSIVTHEDKKVLTRTERNPVKNERPTIFEQEYYIGTVTPVP